MPGHHGGTLPHPGPHKASAFTAGTVSWDAAEVLAEDTTAGVSVNSALSVALGTTRWGVVLDGTPIATWCGIAVAGPLKVHTLHLQYHDGTSWVEQSGFPLVFTCPVTETIDPSPTVAVRPPGSDMGAGTTAVLAFVNEDRGVTLYTWDAEYGFAGVAGDPTLIGGTAEPTNCATPAVDLASNGGFLCAWTGDGADGVRRIYHASSRETYVFIRSGSDLAIEDTDGTPDTPTVAVVAIGETGSIGAVVAWRSILYDVDADGGRMDIRYVRGKLVADTDWGAVAWPAPDGAGVDLADVRYMDGDSDPENPPEVVSLTDDGYSRDCALWASAAGHVWIGWTYYEEVRGYAQATVRASYAAPEAAGDLGDVTSGTVSTFDMSGSPTRREFRQFVNGYAFWSGADAAGTSIATWEVGEVVPAGDRQVVVAAADIAANPEDFLPSGGSDSLPESDLADMSQGQYPSIFLTSTGEVHLFWIRGTGTNTGDPKVDDPPTVLYSRGTLT